MSSAELAYRLWSVIRVNLQRYKYRFFKNKNQPEFEINKGGAILLAEAKGVQAERYYEAAEQVLSGSFGIFALDDVGWGKLPKWNRDPYSKIDAPLSFGKALNYRDSAIVGDIKYLWEPNRHLQLVTIGQAYSLSGKECYLEELDKQLASWIEQCPYLLGPNWASSLELGIRLINWSVVWQLIGGVESSLFKLHDDRCLKRLWLNSIYQHCDFIDRHWSLFSSANNHLIGEAAGLFVASVTWPYWKKSLIWREKARSILLEESLKQNAVDGVNKEQAISYQQFVLDFLVLSGLAARAEGQEFPPEYWDRIEKMLEFIASLMDIKGNMPMIGDADDGYVVKLSQEKEFCPYRSLLATGAVLFGRGDFKEKARKFDDKSRWLLGENGEKKFNTISINNSARLPVRKVFREGGYYILGCDFETDSEIRLVLDCGHLGYLSIAAHGHADTLALTLSIGGAEFLVDPGTYAYHTKKKWRDYFRGTSAHNTVRIDGMDQSVSGGNFMWLQHAKAYCNEWETNNSMDIFSGWHNGYQRLPDPVTHTRRIDLDKITRTIKISDKIEGKRSHLVEWFWHFSEKCKIDVSSAGNILAENDGHRVEIKPDKKINVETYFGNEDPPAGWVSRCYDEKTPSTTVVWRAEINSVLALDTIITCS